VIDAQQGLGFFYWVQQDWEKAASALQRAIQSGASDPMVHLHYAQALVRSLRGDSAEDIADSVRDPALASLTKALQAAPGHAEAARLYGFLCLFDPERTEDGVAVVEKALERHRGHTTLSFILAQLYSKKGDFPAARSIFQSLLKRKLEASLVASIRRRLEYVESRLR
jgi:cytochrome c-type biogenesis protein CcmH/NrfG